jgi:hypothetical protein
MPHPTSKHPVRKLTKSVLDGIKPGPKDEFVDFHPELSR